VFRGDRAKDAELLVLRHENAVRRNVGRVRYEPGDWVWFAAVARPPARGHPAPMRRRESMISVRSRFDSTRPGILFCLFFDSGAPIGVAR